MSQEIIVGLDIGSRAVRMAAGQLVLTGDKQKLQIIGAAEVESAGIVGGAISNVEDAVSAISSCRERLERLIGIPVESAWIGIGHHQILCQESRGLVGIARVSGEIEPSDAERAVEQSRMVATPSNYEILHVVPRSFSVDGQQGIKDPAGMTGVRLEVETLIVQISTSHIKNLTKCVYRTGLEIEDLVLGILANAEAVLTQKQKDLGAAVINIGDATTGLAVFFEGDMIHTAVLPIGSFHITRDIALGAKLPLEVAEKLKVEYGSASSRAVSRREEISISEDEEEMISRKYLAEIIEARVEEIFSYVNNELKKIGKEKILPAGAVLCGGGAKLEGIVDIAKKILKLPVSLGYPIDISSISDKVGNLSFGTAVGLVKWGANFAQDSSPQIFQKAKKAMEKIGGSFSGIFKSIWK